MPIKHDLSQGSPEWFHAKTGIPTSSDFKKILTPGGALSKSADGYANQLIADIMRGGCVEEFVNSPWMERGVVMEGEARDAYELITGYKLEHGGFITDDNRWFGCSPDALIVGYVTEDGEILSMNGGLEIKCPSPAVHMGYLLDQKIEKDYKPQYQGQMYIAELDFVDMFSYHPDLPPARITMERDENYISKLETALMDFRTLMNEKIERLMEMGVWEINTPNPEVKTDVYMAG